MNQFEKYIRDNIQGDKLQLINKFIETNYSELTKIFSYGMPGYKKNKNIIHFAGYEKHIGIYPGPAAIKNFENELSDYQVSKGTIKITNNQVIDFELLKKIIEFNIKREENE